MSHDPTSNPALPSLLFFLICVRFPWHSSCQLPPLPPRHTPQRKNVPAATPCDACVAVDVAFFLHLKGHPAHQIARRARRFLPPPPRSCVTLILSFLLPATPCVCGERGCGLAGKIGRVCVWMRGWCEKGRGVVPGTVGRQGGVRRRRAYKQCRERALRTL